MTRPTSASASSLIGSGGSAAPVMRCMIAAVGRADVVGEDLGGARERRPTGRAARGPSRRATPSPVRLTSRALSRSAERRDQQPVAVAREVDERLPRAAVGGERSRGRRRGWRRGTRAARRSARPCRLPPRSRRRRSPRAPRRRCCASSPMPSISTRTTSPTLSSPSGNGWRTAPIPAGVPVAMTSPGSSVNAFERCATCSKQSKIMSLGVAVLAQLVVDVGAERRGRAGRRARRA